MKIDTFTAVTLTAIAGISLVLLSANTANAGSNEKDTALLAKAMTKALKTPVVKGCHWGTVKMLPGEASRAELSVAARRAAKDGINPIFQKGTSGTRVDIRWFDGAEAITVCLNFEGPGHH